jgi:hypothetical protein
MGIFYTREKGNGNGNEDETSRDRLDGYERRQLRPFIMRLVPLHIVSSAERVPQVQNTHVVVGLVRTVGGETKVVGLLGRHGGELDVELTKMGTCDLLVERLGEHAEVSNIS